MTGCLIVTAVSALLGCADTPVQVPADSFSANVAGTDSVALTYICGNMFRIRNSAFDSRSVRWDIYNASPADTGSLRARGRDVGSAYVDFFVTARTNGTMRLFVGTTLISTKANGNKPACAAPVDVSPLPSTLTLAEPKTEVVTSSPIILAPDSVYYRRTLVNVRFRAEATAAMRRAFQARFGAQLVNAYPTVFQFRLPDLGESYQAFNARIAAIAGDTAVARARPHSAFDRVVIFGARYPDDAIGYRRADYITGARSVWRPSRCAYRRRGPARTECTAESILQSQCTSRISRDPRRQMWPSPYGFL